MKFHLIQSVELLVNKSLERRIEDLWQILKKRVSAEYAVRMKRMLGCINKELGDITKSL